MEAILKATGLKKYYGKGEALVKALDGIDLEIERGKFTAIIGTSGSGKSTLLNMLGGLDTPSKGSIQIGNTELAKLNSEQATISGAIISVSFFRITTWCRYSVFGKTLFSLSLWMVVSLIRSLSWKSFGCLAWRRNWTVCRTIFPVGSSRELRLPVRWLLSLRLSWLTNPPVIWTQKPATM